MSHVENSGGSRNSSNLNAVSRTSYKKDIMSPKYYANGNGDSGHHSEKCLWLGPSKNGGRICIFKVMTCMLWCSCKLKHFPCICLFWFSGSDNLYPADIIPFTRRPLFLIIDSDNSHAFKAGLS